MREKKGGVYLRGAVWWVFFEGPDGREQESAKTADRNIAVRYLEKRLREVENEKDGLKKFVSRDQRRVTVDELLDALLRYLEIHCPKSLRTAKDAIKHARDHFGTLRASEVTPGRIRDYIAWRTAPGKRPQGAKPATVNRTLEKLQRAFTLGIEDGRISFAPKFDYLPEENARQGNVPAEDFEKRMAKIEDEDYRDLFEWLYWTGMRPGAAIGLTWKGFDRETWTLDLHASLDKIGKGSILELTGTFREIIARRLARRRLSCPLIFHLNGRRLTSYLPRWHAAGKAAKVPSFVPYDLRRTSIRNNIKAGIPEKVCMALSGHRTRATFDRYHIVNGEDLRAAAEAREHYENLLRRACGKPAQMLQSALHSESE